MDFQSLSRRELQALCKSNGIRANTSNAAMAEALQCLLLPSVDRTDEIGRTAPPPPLPPMSAMKEVTIVEEQTRGSRLPRGSRAARAKTRMVAVGDTEEDVPDQAALTLQSQGSQRTAAAPGEVIGEEQEHGYPLPRGGRGRGKTRKVGARKTEEEVVPATHTLPGNKTTVAGEAAAAAPVDAEEVAVGMRTRRSARSKVKIALDQKEEDVQAAARKEHKVVSDKSCDDSEEHVVVIVVEEEVTKPQEGQNVTRRAAPYKTHEDLQQDQKTVEEVATAKKRTRRSTRSKVTAAARKGQKADSSDTTVGPEVVPKDDEVVVPKVEEATKPQEGKNVTRRATVYKAQEEVQTGQVTAAPEAVAAVEAQEVVTAKRRRRKSAKSKARVAARKGQKADSSDAAVNGPTVSDDPKEEQVVEVVEEGPTKPHEEEREQISNVRPFASLPKLEDSPILGVVSKPDAADASDKAAVADEEAIKEDGFTFTREVDLSNLLVNTLDRFAKPMYDYESTDNEEKKGGECWWMLL